LFHELPRDTGMAFVLIQHLDPKHHSILAELVSKTTKLPVVEVKDGMKVEANHVYVIPANVNMTISKRTLALTPRQETRGQHLPVDHFMRSLAQDEAAERLA
jgi:two-component system CheB/CheR fusion protein